MITYFSLNSKALRVIRITLFTLICFFVASKLTAQLPSGDLSKLNVDMLSNSQIQTIADNFQSSGMTEEQFFSSLSQRGLPVAEINKLFTRISKIQSASNLTISGKNENNAKGLLTSGDKQLKTGNPEIDKLNPLEKLLFGYKLFHNTDINFTPNTSMATPRNYVVGPRDVLVLQVYGVAQSSYNLTVSPEGKITIPNVGVAHVSGFTIEALTDILKEKLSIRYAGMRGANPNTFLQVTVSNIRTIKINIVGEIFKPGTYTLPSYVDVFNALYAAGGPTVKGSFRSVQVYRNSKQVAEIDVYDFIVNGKANKNIRLEDNDVILIPPTGGRIEISGEIKTPGVFEIKPKENFNDLLKFTGGFTDNAYKQMVSVRRRGLTDNQVFDLVYEKFNQAYLNDGDSITVSALQNRYSNRVQVSGSVFRPGTYELISGMRVKDLLHKAGGVKPGAFLKRALLYRSKIDFTQEVISLDLTDLDNNLSNNLVLQKEDVLNIVSQFDLKEEYYVQVSGEVNNPGSFTFSDSMTLGDLLLKAGGFKYSASGSFIEIARRKFSNNESQLSEILQINIDKDLSKSSKSQSLILHPFDHVFVRNMPGVQVAKKVLIKGEVLYPGEYVIDKKEMRASDLLKRAGGITKFAYVKAATLVRRTTNYKITEPLEKENQTLKSLKDNLLKDGILMSTENNQELAKRIDDRILQNSQKIEEDKTKAEFKEGEDLKKSLLKDNAAFQGRNAVSTDQKEKELVAIDFEAILREPGSAADVVLKDGDEIEIPEKIETISVKGGVLFPVSVKYEEGLSFKQYINRSGGYVPQAMRGRSYVLQANGKVERVRRFLFIRSYPKVLPGAQVFVPVDTRVKAPFSYERGLGLITSTLTLIFLLRTL